MKLKMFALFSCIAISACGTLTTNSNTNVNTIETTCASASAAIKTLSLPMAQNKITPNDVTTINAAIAVITPFCTGPNPPNPTASPTTALTAAANALATFAAEYQTTPQTKG